MSYHLLSSCLLSIIGWGWHIPNEIPMQKTDKEKSLSTTSAALVKDCGFWPHTLDWNCVTKWSLHSQYGQKEWLQLLNIFIVHTDVAALKNSSTVCTLLTVKQLLKVFPQCYIFDSRAEWTSCSATHWETYLPASLSTSVSLWSNSCLFMSENSPKVVNPVWLCTSPSSSSRTAAWSPLSDNSWLSEIWGSYKH